MKDFLKKLRQKPDSTKRKIIIVVAIILILILGTWWINHTLNYLKEVEPETQKINFPDQ